MNKRDFRSIMHTQLPRYVDLPIPEGFAVVTVMCRDTWRPDGGWRSDRPMFTVQTGTKKIWRKDIWSAGTLRPLLECGPFLMPGLLDLILDAAVFCNFKVPAEYAR